MTNCHKNADEDVLETLTYVVLGVVGSKPTEPFRYEDVLKAM